MIVYQNLGALPNFRRSLHLQCKSEECRVHKNFETIEIITQRDGITYLSF